MTRDHVEALIAAIAALGVLALLTEPTWRGWL